MYDVIRGTHMEGMAGNCDPNQIHDLSPPTEASSPPELRVVQKEEVSQGASFDKWEGFDFARLHEYTSDDLRSLFSDKDIADIETWHHLAGEDTDAVVDAMIEQPLPEYNNPGFGKRLFALINNTGSYDENIEDFIASDEIIQKLMARKRQTNLSPEHIKQITRAFRVRRSMLAHQYRE